MRAVAGAVNINVELSPWLLICTFLLALFLAIAKRRNEIFMLSDDGVAESHRSVLAQYSIDLLDQMMAVTTSSTFIAYALYTFDDRTIKEFGTNSLGFTMPFVIYGIYRYV